MSANDLKLYDTLVAELRKNPLLSDCDFSTLEIIALSKKAPPRIIEENLDKVIRNLERQIAFNGTDKILNKKGLCKAMGISRPTLDKWCEYGFISTKTTTQFWGGYEPFELGIVLKQLIELKNKQ
ncbi:MAG TPA: hypothetical protein VFC67_01500 [Prolixibacteraceae bacterium]|nr:hypothetical protein [Prolixibacteraceae bacterium]